jgi:hypothetical protein
MVGRERGSQPVTDLAPYGPRNLDAGDQTSQERGNVRPEARAMAYHLYEVLR